MAFPEALLEVMQMPLALNYLNFDVDVITGDGKLGDPEKETLDMLTEARQSEDYTLQFAFRARKDGLDKKLDDFFGSAQIDRNYRRIFRPPDEKSLIVNLLDPVRY